MNFRMILALSALLTAPSSFANAPMSTTHTLNAGAHQADVASVQPSQRARQAKWAQANQRPGFTGKRIAPSRLRSLGGEYLPTNLVDQPIDLESGWTIVSFQSLPTNTDAAAVLADIEEDLLLIKDNSGNFYMPEVDFNGLGDLEFGQGYFVNMKFERFFTVRGRPAEPTMSMSLQPGWNTIGTTLATPIDALCLDRFLHDTDPNYAGLLMIDSNGAELDSDLQTNDIGDLEPGFGYQLHLDSSQNATFTWAEVESHCVP